MTSTLKLVSERKIIDLMPGNERIDRWEASGVLVNDGKHSGAAIKALKPSHTSGATTGTTCSRFVRGTSASVATRGESQAEVACNCSRRAGTPGGTPTRSICRKLFCSSTTRACPLIAAAWRSSRKRIQCFWIGQFNEADWAWRDAGQLYEFPRSDEGSILYGNIEGVGWITPTRVVAVSDRRKKKTQKDKWLTEKDQSIHIFYIPSS